MHFVSAIMAVVLDYHSYRRIMKKVLSVLLVLTIALTFSACGDKDENNSADEKFTVGFLYIGTTNDGGYTEAQDTARLAIEEKLGAKIKCIYRESIPDTNKQEVESAALQMIDEGASLIVGTSFGYGDALKEMADSGDYDDVNFLHFSGTKTFNDKNLDNYFGSIEEPRYLSGVIAGLQTETNKLGYVAAFPFTEVQIGINAFTLGARSVNKDVEVKVIYINSWGDAAKEKQAAEELLNQDCDILTQHADTTGTQLAAADAGKLTIGYNLDNSAVPGLENAYLTAPVWHHEVYLVPAIEAMMAGTWSPATEHNPYGYYGSLKDGYVGLAPLTKNVTAEAKRQVAKVQEELVSGEFSVFSATDEDIKDNAGKVVIKKGETLSTPEIWKTDYLVSGAKSSERN
jgi:basic membrane protein A